ncbi:MAG: VOC family protein [Leptospiraceae bacterium]|nr:VOC family protein [Leptospiraceae bacterium]MBK9500803.1 VOC family protein [Leptospiraceae bacterium]
MKRIIISLITIIFAMSILHCGYKEKKMNSYIGMFEIPATNITRAINFYESILGIKIEKMELKSMKMGILPYEGQQVTGVIIEAEGYEPSTKGVTIYLNAGENLQNILDKITQNGGKILIPKTPHEDQDGFFAVFIDSEGNKLGLHSKK